MRYFIFFLFITCANILSAQDTTTVDTSNFQVGEILVIDGDTLLFGEIEELIVSPLTMTPEEQKVHDYYDKVSKKNWSKRGRTYFLNVDPIHFLSDRYTAKIKRPDSQYNENEIIHYAREAVNAYKDYEQNTQDLSKRKRRKYSRKKKKSIKKEYDPSDLKKLTKVEGLLLIKMIEREIDKPFYDIIKDLRGRGNAMYWQGMAKMASVADLKEGYDPKVYPIMEKTFNQQFVSDKINSPSE